MKYKILLGFAALFVVAGIIYWNHGQSADTYEPILVAQNPAVDSLEAVVKDLTFQLHDHKEVILEQGGELELLTNTLEASNKKAIQLVAAIEQYKRQNDTLRRLTACDTLEGITIAQGSVIDSLSSKVDQYRGQVSDLIVLDDLQDRVRDSIDAARVQYAANLRAALAQSEQANARLNVAGIRHIKRDKIKNCALLAAGVYIVTDILKTTIR